MSAPLRASHRSAYLLITPCTAASLCTLPHFIAPHALTVPHHAIRCFVPRIPMSSRASASHRALHTARLNLPSPQLVYRAARLILSFIASPSPSNGIGAIAILAKRGSLSAVRI